jgi:hypothetical protein
MFNNEHHVISNFKNKSFRTDLLQVLRKESNTKSIMKKQTEKNSYLLLNRCWALNFLVVKEWIQLLVGKKKTKAYRKLRVEGNEAWSEIIPFHILGGLSVYNGSEEEWSRTRQHSPKLIFRTCVCILCGGKV